jgi:hypothetical protein
MTSNERIELFQRGILAIEKLESVYPSYPPFESIRNQLLFLLGQASGAAEDREQLSQINLGYIVMREVESRDAAAADLLYLVSEEAGRMLTES